MSTNRLGCAVCIVAALAAIALVAVAPVAAQAPPARAQGPALNWVRRAGADSCVAPSELARLVERHAGRSVFVAAADAVLSIEGHVGPDSHGGYVAVIAVSDGEGTVYGRRELATSGDCRQLDEPLSLVIAVTLRGGAAGGIALPPDVSALLENLFGHEETELDPAQLPAAPAHTAQASVAASTVPPAADAPADSAPDPQGREPNVWPTFTLGAFVQSGVQPSAALGPQLTLWLDTARAGSYGVQARLGVRRVDYEVDDPSVASQTGVGTDLGFLWSTSLRGCPLVHRAAQWEFAGCVEASLGQLTMSGTRDFAAFNSQETERRLWVAAGLAGHVRVTLSGPVFLWLDAEVQARLLNASYTFVDAFGEEQVLYDTPPVGVGTALGVGVSLR